MSDKPPATTVDMTSPNQLLTTEQFCRWVGISYRTWRLWVASGTAPRRIKVGRGTRIKVSDALAWANSRYIGD